MYTVLVTGIGGNVGQGILRNLRLSGLPLRLVGTNTVALSAGNFFCDIAYTVPAATDADFADVIRNICSTEGVSLVIPSTDYETYHLGLVEGLPRVAAFPPETARLFLDKWRTFEVLSKASIPFAQSWLPSQVPANLSFPVIAKPREGRGSRGLVVQPTSFTPFTDEEYLVQRMHSGPEVSSAVYVNQKGELHALMTFRRMLGPGGATFFCEITHDYDDQVMAIARALWTIFGLKGSFNIQSIVCQETGQVTPFEINARISGTNSIRTQFGFEDSKWTVEELLLNQAPSPAQLMARGAAVRYIADIIYPGASLDEIAAGKPLPGSFVYS